ncbi:hypothetical protein HDU87_001707 [Geranomyces variabilis]|uniref:Essential for reactive oxygen species protein n=1 Tax=Geranomyces variabilis TaxID=109894 RepID=A0AAD5XLR7_9FUNG|nr:hypothetical protein HDU87_001707 [Geranomyces variabilis]
MLKWKTIHPRISTTATRLEICPVEAGAGDWAMMAIILIFGLAMTIYTTSDWNYRIFGGGLYVYLAWSLVVDTVVTIIDKTAKEVRVTKSTLGFKQWVRVAPTDELVAVHTVEEQRKRGGPGYRLELEFMSDHGYYRLPMTETYVLGDANREQLAEMEKAIRKFMDLKQLPDWMKEENLDDDKKRHARRREMAKDK